MTPLTEVFGLIGLVEGVPWVMDTVVAPSPPGAPLSVGLKHSRKTIVRDEIAKFRDDRRSGSSCRVDIYPEYPVA